jgi:phenylacetate-CoA ligase
LKAGEFWALLGAQRDLRRNARLTRSEFEARKLQRFRRLVRKANDASPYYAGVIRDHAIDVETCVPEDFPVLTKRDLMANFDEIVTDRRITRRGIADFLSSSNRFSDLYLGEYHVLQTSGSTGEKAYVVYSRHDWARAMAQYLRNTGSRRPRRLGRPRLAYCGAIAGHHGGISIGGWWKRSMARFFVDFGFFEVNRPLEVTVAELNSFRPDYLLGYTNGIKTLGEQALNGSLRISPLSVTVGGEMVTDADKAFLQRAFGCEVVSTYASCEHLAMGVSRGDDTRMILYDDDVIYEFQRDHILTTNLVNQAMPLIRYQMSDVIEPSGGDGLGEPPYLEIESLIGRSEMWARFVNERGVEDIVNPQSILRVSARGLLRCQIHLLSKQAFKLLVCLDASLTEPERDSALEEMRAQLAAIMAQKGMRNVAFEITAVDALDVDPTTGKFRLVVPPAGEAISPADALGR